MPAPGPFAGAGPMDTLLTLLAGICLLLAIVLVGHWVRRSAVNSPRGRFAAQQGWLYEGSGAYSGCLAGVDWHASPQEDTDSGRRWTDFSTVVPQGPTGRLVLRGTSRPGEALAEDGPALPTLDLGGAGLRAHCRAWADSPAFLQALTPEVQALWLAAPGAAAGALSLRYDDRLLRLHAHGQRLDDQDGMARFIRLGLMMAQACRDVPAAH